MQKLGVVVLMTVLGAMAAVAPAYAESNKIAVNIPFDFVVGKTAMKAGEYKIEKLQSGVLELIGEKQVRFALTVEGSPSGKHAGDAYVVFNRYGNETFLSKVALSDEGNYDLPPSNREKQLNQHGLEDRDMVVQPAR